MMTSLKSRIHIPEDVLYHDLNGEAVVLNLKSGKYFSLDAVGSHMWQLLAEHYDVATVYQSLLAEYEVDGETLRKDLFELIDNLGTYGLVKVDAEAAEES